MIEKLTELVCDVLEDGCIGHCNHPPCWKVTHAVDCLIANGVTIQKWIPVTERLPEEDGKYLVYKGGFSWLHDVFGFAKDGRKISKYDFADNWKNVWYFYDGEYGYVKTNSVTHWMPLPQPPKGE